MGGEKLSRIAGNAAVGGSPPRGRGKVGVYGQVAGQQGITPAWAGKRKQLFSHYTLTKDHPRVGGEKITRRPRLKT